MSNKNKKNNNKCNQNNRRNKNNYRHNKNITFTKNNNKDDNIKNNNIAKGIYNNINKIQKYTVNKISKINKKIKKTTKINRKRKKIPFGVRENVWKKYNGNKFNAKCYVNFCNQKLTPFNFDVGHNIPHSKGGSDSIDNLRPICRNCNVSMGNAYTIEEYSDYFK